MFKNLFKIILFLVLFTCSFNAKSQNNIVLTNSAKSIENLMKNYDTNKDGYISKLEANSNKNQSLIRRFDKIDSDRNGFISREEIREMNKLNSSMKNTLTGNNSSNSSKNQQVRR